MRRCGSWSIAYERFAKVRVASSNLVARSDQKALVTGPFFCPLVRVAVVSLARNGDGLGKAQKGGDASHPHGPQSPSTSWFTTGSRP